MSFPGVISFGESITARQVNLKQNQGESLVSQIGQIPRNGKKFNRCKGTGHIEKDCTRKICGHCSKPGYSEEFCVKNPASAVFGKSIAEARAAYRASLPSSAGAAKPAVTNPIFEMNRIRMLLESDEDSEDDFEFINREYVDSAYH